jgi:hypothetical protein
VNHFVGMTKSSPHFFSTSLDLLFRKSYFYVNKECMEIIKIDLSSYKSDKSTVFTGRLQGEITRKKLKLDVIDANEKTVVIFLLPDDTTSFNPSFYLGMLFKTYQTLGIDKVDFKYRFEFVTKDETIRKVLIDNLEDGKRYAINSLNSMSSFKSLYSNIVKFFFPTY